jgi:hypothetical protein
LDTITINCSGIRSEPEFWRIYLETVKPEGTHFFGCNLDAFNDALTGGGPGWPGECQVHFINTESLQCINDGEFYRKLLEIMAQSVAAPVHFE